MWRWKENHGRLEGRKNALRAKPLWYVLEKGLTVMWGIRDSRYTGFNVQNHQSAPLMPFIFSPCSRRGRSPETVAISEPRGLITYRPRWPEGSRSPLNGGLCLSATFKKHMLVASLRVSCGGSSGKTETYVLSFNADNHQPTVRIFDDLTCSLGRPQRPHAHISRIIPHNEKHR